MKSGGVREPWRLAKSAISEIVSGRHRDPFAVLGPQEVSGVWVARAFIPGAEKVTVETLEGTQVGTLDKREDDGFFEGKIALKNRQALRYAARRGGDEWRVTDPYSFGPVLGPMDDYYASEGTHLRLFDRLGAHVMTHEGARGIHFAVWAPEAKRVSVVGDFNAWDGRRHAMRHRTTSGMWEIFVPDVGAGAYYKFEIIGANGKLLPLKADPFAFHSEKRPGTASIVADPAPFRWSDGGYVEERKRHDPRRAPMSIYEVHLGSWRRRGDGSFMTYGELADTLIPYVADLGFTHLELMPVMEHPLDASWGYQTTGLFAPTSRFGDPAGFAHFVDAAHAANLGILLDWVPAHFPTDPHGLSRFDGTPLYEHADPRQGFHPDWKTAIYNYGRTEVSEFLINSALFWIERFHADGLRVDAVASMLYLDYSRKPGEWLPNKHGGNENLDAVAFLQRMNSAAYGRDLGTTTIAEESTAWPGVSLPVDAGGLGFGFKWNMGFMHDTLRYLAREPVHRKHHHNDITFGLLYAFAENFVLPLSHDEVVHGKRSLLGQDGWRHVAEVCDAPGLLRLHVGLPGKEAPFHGAGIRGLERMGREPRARLAPRRRGAARGRCPPHP